jgi:hypothetical protein
VALHPEQYEIRQIWQLAGDELGTALFYESSGPSRSPEDQERIDEAIDRLSRQWWLHDYPWAGSLSTAHTLLWYARASRNIFKEQAKTHGRKALPGQKSGLKIRYDVQKIMDRAWNHEAGIWDQLIHELKAVSLDQYEALAKGLPPVYPEKTVRSGRTRLKKR